MKDTDQFRTMNLVRGAVAAPLGVLFTPTAALALTRSCSMLPTLAEWVFDAAYLGCVIALAGIGGARLAGRLRPRSLLYPIWAAMLLFVLQFVVDGLWLDMIRQGQPMCYPH